MNWPGPCAKSRRHSSKTSSTEPVLAAFRPSVAIISVGPGDSYLWPAERGRAGSGLREHHAMVFRTDQDGLIFLRERWLAFVPGNEQWRAATRDCSVIG
jgi:beta-lactamase superfamily II metal-dependent hydrolase